MVSRFGVKTMNKPVVSVEGRRVYIQTAYGHPVVNFLKAMGAHWDAESKRWWIGSTKLAEVNKAIEKAEKQPATFKQEDVMVVGKATYKGKSYYVRWYGETRDAGKRKARLCSLDGKLDFWASMDRRDPHFAEITKEYEEPMRLEKIQAFVKKIKEEKAQYGSTGRVADDLDEGCYRGPGGEVLVQGCGECRARGSMCERCKFDIYDM